MKFLDTNILLYAVSTVSRERTKAQIARQILEEGDLALSVQVLQEFYVQATRADKADRLSHEQALLLIQAWVRFPVQPTTVELLFASLGTRERFQLSYWDAAIVEGARLAGCGTVLTEDLSDGQDFDGVRIQNPFRAQRLSS